MDVVLSKGLGEGVHTKSTSTYLLYVDHYPIKFRRCSYPPQNDRLEWDFKLPNVLAKRKLIVKAFGHDFYMTMVPHFLYIRASAVALGKAHCKPKSFHF